MKLAHVSLALAVALALASITIGTIIGGWPALGYASAGAALAVVFFSGSYLRDARVRRLVCTAYRADVAAMGLGHLAEVLPTPDVVQARTDHLRREEAMLATRYANGDASDY